ncbi:MAG: DUF2971 domain-containing protein [Methylococcales bacterium]|nr:DUF2971 domain-containing protein [Methylococcales bacterium]
MLEHFYKYTDIETAKLILINQSFRYSSPLKFNDPFDIQNELLSSFDLNKLPTVIQSVIETYVKNDFPIQQDNFGILMLREKATSQGYNKKIETMIYPYLQEVVNLIKDGISELNESWKTSLQESRVFCVTEGNDNLLMWAHYAKNHTGVVFQLATLAADGNILSAAEKVIYEEKPIAFYSIEELVKWILFNIEPDFSKVLYTSHAYQKSKHWEYENEWRVIDMREDKNKTEFYIDHKFESKQLQNIFFGCKTAPSNIKHLSSIARAINPSVGIYQSKKRPLEYALDFEKI